MDLSNSKVPVRGRTRCRANTPRRLRPGHALFSQSQEFFSFRADVSTGEDAGFVSPFETGDSDEAQLSRHRRHIPIQLESAKELGLVLVGVLPIRSARRRNTGLRAPHVSSVGTDSELQSRISNRRTFVNEKEEIPPRNFVELMTSTKLWGHCRHSSLIEVLQRPLEFKGWGAR
jgi:hypothetical protein